MKDVDLPPTDFLKRNRFMVNGELDEKGAVIKSKTFSFTHKYKFVLDLKKYNNSYFRRTYQAHQYNPQDYILYDKYSSDIKVENGGITGEMQF